MLVAVIKFATAVVPIVQEKGMSEVKDDNLCQETFYCPPGTENATLTCPEGHYCPTGTGQSQPKCPTGSYSNTKGLGDEQQCTKCTAGYYCPEQGLVVGCF